MIRKLKVAVVGTGYFSQFHFDAWSRCPDVEIVGVSSLDRDAAQTNGERFGCPAYDDVALMCGAAKPDLLDIITPPPTHEEMIAVAASFGVDVVCQKPFCGTLEAARRATEYAEHHNINVTIHENFRFQPWYGAIKSILDERRLGRLFQATFRLRPGDGQGAEAYLARQPYFRDMKRFLVHETAIHWIDVFRYLIGEVETVWADMSRLNEAIAGEDRCLIVMTHEDGARSVLDGNRLSDHVAKNRRLTMGEMTIEGENGVLTLSGDAELTIRSHGSNETESINYPWADNGFGGDCVYRFTRHVVDHYLTGTPIMNSARDYLQNLKLEEAVYDAAETGNLQVY